eukprot:Gb_29746 [translate_table: standard]
MTKQSLKSVTAAERSQHFARREAAKVLRCVLKGDAERRAVASIKSLVYKPSVRNKKGTLALVCQTLKYFPILKNILAATNLLSSKWKRQAELIYIITYDILFGQEVVSTGDAEFAVLAHKNTLRSILAQICVKENVRCPQDLLPLDNQISGLSKPRYVRVNTLKVDVESALKTLQKAVEVKQDDLISDLLVLPPGTDLHSHPLVMNGELFLQGKASCMAAVALNPLPDWEVLDACAAPGNKTVQLAGLMKGRGKIFACELNNQRLKRLEETVKIAGASNVEILHGDFLKLNPDTSKYSKVRAILLDPSCSGSGTTSQRLDHLLPSHTAGHGRDATEIRRINNLAAFQKKALLHALSFPAVESVVYSTCSIHQIENEDVINSVLPHARTLNFNLATPFPDWPHRGLPVFEGAQHLLRTEAARDMEGFFIALFVRCKNVVSPGSPLFTEGHGHTDSISDVTDLDISLPKVKLERKLNPQSTKKRPLVIQGQAEPDPLSNVPGLDVSQPKPKTPESHARKAKNPLYSKNARNTRKKTILGGLPRTGLGGPKVFHLLYNVNCRTKNTKKWLMDKRKNLHKAGKC